MKLNNAHLKVGEKVICTKDVDFIDGLEHRRGQVVTVEPETQAYYSLFTGNTEDSRYLKIETHMMN